MSEVRLKDGHGTGNTALVDDHGRLAVNAINVSHEQHHSSYHSNLFTGVFDATLPDASETPVMFYKNTHSGQDYEFYHITISSDSDILIHLHYDDVYTSGGTAPQVANMNRGSGNVATYAAYEGGASGDIVLDETNQEHGGSYYVKAREPYEIDFRGGLILTTNTTFTITATGAAADEVTATVMFARHSAGYKL